MTPGPTEFEVTKPPADPARSVAVTGLAWGVRSSFRRYVQRIGTVTTDSAAGSLPDSRFYFPVASVREFDPEVFDARVEFHGGVRFFGHGGMLDLRLGEFELQLKSGRGVLMTGSQADARVLMEVRATEARSNDEVVAITLACRLAQDAEELFGEMYTAALPFDDIEARLPLAR